MQSQDIDSFRFWTISGRISKSWRLVNASFLFDTSEWSVDFFLIEEELESEKVE